MSTALKYKLQTRPKTYFFQSIAFKIWYFILKICLLEKLFISFFLNGLTIDEQKDISIDGKVFTPLSIIVYILILAPGRKTILYSLQ